MRNKRPSALGCAAAHRYRSAALREASVSDSRRKACIASTPTIGLLGCVPLGGHDGEWMRLRSAQPAVGAHELLERGNLVGDRVVHAVDEDVGAVRKAVVAAQVFGRGRVEVGERVLALDGVVARRRCPAPPITIAPCACERTITKPMPGWAVRVSSSRGWRSAICSARQPLGAERQVDSPRQPETITTASSSLGRVLGARSAAPGPRGWGRARRCPPTDRLRVARASDPPADARLLAGVGQHRAHVAPGLVDRRRCVDLALRERSPARPPRASRRSAGGRARPASGRDRRAPPGGRGAATGRSRAPAAAS